jgi:hypothetical protein
MVALTGELWVAREGGGWLEKTRTKTKEQLPTQQQQHPLPFLTTERMSRPEHTAPPEIVRSSFYCFCFLFFDLISFFFLHSFMMRQKRPNTLQSQHIALIFPFLSHI